MTCSASASVLPLAARDVAAPRRPSWELSRERTSPRAIDRSPGVMRGVCRWLAGVGAEVRYAEAGAAGARTRTAARHEGTCAAAVGVGARAGNNRSRAIGSGGGAGSRNRSPRPIGSGGGAGPGNGGFRALGSCRRAGPGSPCARAVRPGRGARGSSLDAAWRRRVGSGERGEGNGRNAGTGNEDLGDQVLSHGPGVPHLDGLETSETSCAPTGSFRTGGCDGAAPRGLRRR